VSAAPAHPAVHPRLPPQGATATGTVRAIRNVAGFRFSETARYQPSRATGARVGHAPRLQRLSSRIVKARADWASLLSLEAPKNGVESASFHQGGVDLAGETDWVVVDAVSSEPVSGPNSLLTGKFTGNFERRRPFAAGRIAQ